MSRLGSAACGRLLAHTAQCPTHCVSLHTQMTQLTCGDNQLTPRYYCTTRFVGEAPGGTGRSGCLPAPAHLQHPVVSSMWQASIGRPPLPLARIGRGVAADTELQVSIFIFRVQGPEDLKKHQKPGGEQHHGWFHSDATSLLIEPSCIHLNILAPAPGFITTSPPTQAC